MRSTVHKLKTVDTAGLQYNIRLAINFPYSLTCNIDIADGLVNGCTGNLRFIEYDDRDNTVVKRLWLSFSNPKLGNLTRKVQSSLFKK